MEAVAEAATEPVAEAVTEAATEVGTEDEKYHGLDQQEILRGDPRL